MTSPGSAPSCSSVCRRLTGPKSPMTRLPVLGETPTISTALRCCLPGAKWSTWKATSRCHPSFTVPSKVALDSCALLAPLTRIGAPGRTLRTDSLLPSGCIVCFAFVGSNAKIATKRCRRGYSAYKPHPLLGPDLGQLPGAFRRWRNRFLLFCQYSRSR